MKKTEDEFIRKRKARQRKLRKRRRRRLLIGLLFGALLVFCVLAVTVLFPIKSIKVTGSKRYDEQTVLAASGLKAGDNIIIASEKSCTKRLRQVLPYVKSVSFGRSLSGQLTIRITEEKEARAYLWNDKYYLVSEENHILRQAEEAPQGLLVIAANIKKPVVGEEIIFSSEKTESAIEDILASVKENGLKPDMVDLRQEVSLSLKTEGRFLVKLGTGNYLNEKLKHLAAMVKTIESDKTGSIDLSMWEPDDTQGIWVEKSIE